MDLGLAGPRQAAAADLTDTPVPVIDLDIVDRNIARLQAACDAAGLANRPHIKTHKSVALMQRQLAAGAAGITCQKLGEAELMAEGGATDILISFNLLGADKPARAARLASRVRLTVACDNPVSAEALSAAMADAAAPLRVLVECDTGRRRCGVESPAEAVALAERIAGLPGLAFEGLLLYPPNGPVDSTAAFLAAVRAGCGERGLALSTVSTGGTPNIARMAEMAALGATEYRSGTSIFNDRQMIAAGAARLEDCALMIHATVVSRPAPGRAMLDAGSKTLTSDLGGVEGYGMLVDYPQARIHQLAEEHGFVDVSACPRAPQIGEVVRVLPNHVCPVVNLFDSTIWINGGAPPRRMPVDARGLVR